ncbi:Mss4-like protein [Rhodocollybia butyracea]|uniref:Mss4-like protein n=1 Tax=Rhodocollybia butyracea TaxID=206335 RepID=A0A9P5Q437_9AGAR|nr:Mss4-like protein [Rhodocollybia butyracea]
MTTYSGNCHCGLVKFTITLPGSIYDHNIANCNCSHCARNGSLFIYFPTKEIKYYSGEADLKGYSASFGFKVVEHMFCPQCGSSTGWKCIEPRIDNFPGVEAVNVRMLNNVDIEKLKLGPFDGRTKIGGEYELGKWYEKIQEKVEKEV